MDLVVAIVIALSLDYWLGEPKRLHPLVGFGALAVGGNASLFYDIDRYSR